MTKDKLLGSLWWLAMICLLMVFSQCDMVDNVAACDEFVAPFADNGTNGESGYSTTPWPDSHEWLKENGWLRGPFQE